MVEQLRLEGTEVERSVVRLRPATIALGKRMVAECREILAAAHRGSLDDRTLRPPS